MSDKPIDPLLITLLNYLLTANLLDACHWQLSKTSVYKQSLKNKLAAVQREIEPVISRELKLLEGTDDQAMFCMLEGMDALMVELASVRPEQLVALMHIVRKLKEDPDEVLRRLEVEIVEEQELEVSFVGEKEVAA